jgi:hypothetical protein
LTDAGPVFGHYTSWTSCWPRDPTERSWPNPSLQSYKTGRENIWPTRGRAASHSRSLLAQAFPLLARPRCGKTYGCAAGQGAPIELASEAPGRGVDNTMLPEQRGLFRQTAAFLDHESWSRLANEAGAAQLLPDKVPRQWLRQHTSRATCSSGRPTRIRRCRPSPRGSRTSKAKQKPTPCLIQKCCHFFCLALLFVVLSVVQAVVVHW